MKGPDQFRKSLYSPQVSASDRHTPLHLLFLCYELLLCLIDQLQYLLRPVPEQKSLICKRYFSTSSYEQFHSHLIFHLRELTAQCRLCNMEHLCRPCDALLPHYRQKISQYPYLHSTFSFLLHLHRFHQIVTVSIRSPGTLSIFLSEISPRRTEPGSSSPDTWQMQYRPLPCPAGFRTG